MFAPLGLFKDIPCPQGDQCPLMSCIFSHRSLPQPSTTQDEVSEQREITEPAPKRIKLAASANKAVPKGSPSAAQNGTSTPANRSSEPVSRSENTLPAPRQTVTKKPAAPVQREAPSTSKDPSSNSGPVSGSTLPPRQAPKEALSPRMLAKAPASYNTRDTILKRLFAALGKLNDKVANDVFAKNDNENKDQYLVLSSDELVTMALDEEEKVARESPLVYSNVVKLRIVKLSKMSKDEWIKELKEYLNKKYYKLKPATTTEGGPKKPSRPFSTGMTVQEELAILPKLLTPLQGLESHGYVTKPPSASETETAKRGVAEAKGWEKCERCSARFQVFPGRREDGSLTTGGTCTHHPGKAFYPPREKTDHITGSAGSREGYFTCCNEKLGQSAGCTVGETHVYKVSETKRLASILQFEETPDNQNQNQNDKDITPLSFDCEMGYTTLGLELIRLTAVSWPQGKRVLDVLVRPLGEVLDLNSRFSGVYPEHYTNALPYDISQPPPPTISPETGPDPQQLYLVPSPSAARNLLFTHLTRTTPLIGHAIDNDLNACRIIHPAIIDTAILYPHPGGKLPYRMSLRTLARKHLDREIQTGSKGHDSVEDAVATGDLVRVKAKEVWGRLKGGGWIVQDGRLVAPAGGGEGGMGVNIGVGLGPGAGVKSGAGS